MDLKKVGKTIMFLGFAVYCMLGLCWLQMSLSQNLPTISGPRQIVIQRVTYRAINNSPVSFEAFPFDFGVDCLADMSSRNARAACD